MMIYDGGTGRDMSRSLSLASNICVLAIAALPIIISAKHIMPYAAKYTQPSPTSASGESEKNIPPNINIITPARYR